MGRKAAKDFQLKTICISEGRKECPPFIVTMMNNERYNRVGRGGLVKSDSFDWNAIKIVSPHAKEESHELDF